MLSTMWDREGQRKQLDGFPASLEHWSLGEEIDQSRRTLLDRVEVALSSKVLSTDVRASSRNLVLEVELEDDQRVIVRVPPEPSPTPTAESAACYPATFESEAALLVWLHERTSLPVPRVHVVIHRSEEEPNTFLIMEKIRGDCLMNVYGGLPYVLKESIVLTMAEIMLDLHTLEVPQRIGTTLIHGDVVNVVPLATIPFPPTHARVFDTLEEYILGLIEAKRTSSLVGTDDGDLSTANVVLDRLAKELPPIFHHLSAPSCRRCVLSHDDLHGANVLVDGEGQISGIVDWEFHSIVPLVLAAKYPSWIRYDGLCDPLFAIEGSWWHTSQEDAAKLRAVYADVIKEKNVNYWRALVDGELLRQVEEWLTMSWPDPGCARMSAWMDIVFPPRAE
ncbi:kinase-like protein [Lentinus tigrinus ALCF2SS1-7]|uniref:Kinase-like protein n=1 Tax=Lentinus tigrinus ALCF2SS1-6 TaxID=1328759 RepID=A0A5C2RSB5_9APHY|nr:kinase-like protein [Lentinus tigrinus ALCF2SS1-6]RPD68605.1 kinase-like protein [Lentinus tigrinus ALCF2SS1-7]